MKPSHCRASAAVLVLTLIVTALPIHAQSPTEVWVRRYDSPSHHPSDRVAKVVADAAGNAIVTGTDGADFACYTAKYAASDGALLWQRRHRIAGAISDWSEDAAVDGAGNVVITGVTESATTHGDLYTAKYAAADGALLWEHRYNGPENSDDRARGVAVDASGNVIVTGIAGTGYTAKYAAANGALLWEQRGPFSPARVVVDRNGNVIITGDGGSSRSAYYTAKYAGTNGAFLWEHRYDGPVGGWAEASSVAVDAAGNVAVTGHTVHPSRGLAAEIYTAKYASNNGSLLWEKSYFLPHGPFAKCYGHAVSMDSRGNVIVTGEVNSEVFTNVVTIKYRAADGAILWKKGQPRPNAEFGRAAGLAMAVDSADNVIVTGYDTNDEAFSGSYYTAKYAAASGALLWERRHGRGDARSNSLAVGNGFVVVTGREKGDFATVKYLDGPTPQTIRAEVLSASSAKLVAAVNPNGVAAEAAFEYGVYPTMAAATRTAATPIGNGSDTVSVSFTLSSLRPRTKYYYRAIGTGSGVTLGGEVLSFTTLPATEPVARPTPRPMLRR